jgi:hypothetical protein
VVRFLKTPLRQGEENAGLWPKPMCCAAAWFLILVAHTSRLHAACMRGGACANFRIVGQGLSVVLHGRWASRSRERTRHRTWPRLLNGKRHRLSHGLAPLSRAAGDPARGGLSLGTWIVRSQRELALSHGCCAQCWPVWPFTRRTAICATDLTLSPLLRRKRL